MFEFVFIFRFNTALLSSSLCPASILFRWLITGGGFGEPESTPSSARAAEEAAKAAEAAAKAAAAEAAEEGGKKHKGPKICFSTGPLSLI